MNTDRRGGSPKTFAAQRASYSGKRRPVTASVSVLAIAVVLLIPLCLGGCGSSNSAKILTGITVPGSSSPASALTTTSAPATTQPVQTTEPAQTAQTPPAPTPQTNTPEEAIEAWWQANGDGSRIVFKRSKYSVSDPAWAYFDYQRFEGNQHFVFLVHKSNGLWAVVSMANNGPLSATNNGGPGDLTYP